MVLPCPGSSAWSAPSPAAIRAAESNTQKLNLRRVEINSVKRLRGVFWGRAASGSGATSPSPEGRVTLMAAVAIARDDGRADSRAARPESGCVFALGKTVRPVEATATAAEA